MSPSASSSLAADDRLVRRWVSAHLYYHDALDALLCSGVRPLADALTAGGLTEGFFFVRYWQGGRHVRLRVLPHDDVGEEQVKGLIEEHIGGFFARFPSPTNVRREDYLRAAGWLCQHEFGQREITIEPLRPNNSLRYVAYVPETDRLGGPRGVAAFEPHFTDSSTIALDLVAADPNHRQRTGQALAMMLLAAAVAVPDLQRLAGFFQASYRNWAARLAAGDRSRYERYETAFGQHYDRQRAALDDLARRLLDSAGQSTGDHVDATSARWTASIAALRDRLTGGQLALEPLLFQVLHKHNNRLGVSMAEETYLLFLLQRTLSEITKRKETQ